MSANRERVSDSDMGNSLSFSELRGPNLSTRVAGGQTLGPIRKRQPSPPPLELLFGVLRCARGVADRGRGCRVPRQGELKARRVAVGSRSSIRGNDGMTSVLQIGSRSEERRVGKE